MPIKRKRKKECNLMILKKKYKKIVPAERYALKTKEKDYAN